MATATSPPGQRHLNVPNVLTASRFVLALVLFVLIGAQAWLACLVVFAMAAVTDFLDGYLARRMGITSTLGRNLDPLVDKVLMCGAFIFLLPEPAAGVTPWIAVIIVARELVITGLRGFLESQGIVFGADNLGKLKMALQCAALIAIFVALQAHGQAGPEVPLLAAVSGILVYAMVAATAWSGLQYLWKAAQLLKH